MRDWKLRINTEVRIHTQKFIGTVERYEFLLERLKLCCLCSDIHMKQSSLVLHHSFGVVDKVHLWS